jgi:hypothetical protein
MVCDQRGREEGTKGVMDMVALVTDDETFG